ESLMRTARIAALAAASAFAAAATGQMAQPGVFVTNNGNNEGAVTSFGFNPDGTLRLLDRVVLGAGSGPGTNAAAVDVSADGRYLPTGHATAYDPEQLTIIAVGPDGALAVVGELLVPNAPLDLVWIDHEYLAVATSSFGVATNGVGVYRSDASAGTLTEVYRSEFGTFCTDLLMHRTERVLYAQNSPFSAGEVWGFEVDGDGQLAVITIASSAPNFPLGMGMTPDGSKLYSTGGISGSGHDI